MKKIIALVLLSFVALGMAVGEEEPKWLENPQKYAKDNYPDLVDDYIFYYAQSAQGGTGRGTAKNAAQLVFLRDLRNQIKGIATQFSEGHIHDANTDDLEAEDYATQEYDTTVAEVVQNANFSHYKYLEYYYIKRQNSKGQDRYECYVYGCVPKKAISDLLLSVQNDVIKEIGKKVEISESVKDALDSAREELFSSIISAY